MQLSSSGQVSRSCQNRLLLHHLPQRLRRSRLPQSAQAYWAAKGIEAEVKLQQPRAAGSKVKAKESVAKRKSYASTVLILFMLLLQYIPAAGEPVIGIIIARHAEGYRVDLGSAQMAALDALAFEDATKRNKPNLKVSWLTCAFKQGLKTIPAGWSRRLCKGFSGFAFLRTGN